MVKIRKPGAQPGNKNGVRHGAYMQVFDARTRLLGKAQRQVEAALITSLGDPSPQETLLVQRAAVKAVRCWALEGELWLERHRTQDPLGDPLRQHLTNHFQRQGRQPFTNAFLPRRC